VPLGIGAKPKQSQRSKLDDLLAGSPVPSALAAASSRHSRRFVAADPRQPPSSRTSSACCRGLPAELQATLSCATSPAFDALAEAERAGLVDTYPARRTLATQPIDRWTGLAVLAREIDQRAGIAVFDRPQRRRAERPGRNRFFKPDGGELSTSSCDLQPERAAGPTTFVRTSTPGDYQARGAGAAPAR
jgi:hypothetical protein